MCVAGDARFPEFDGLSMGQGRKMCGQKNVRAEKCVGRKIKQTDNVQGTLNFLIGFHFSALSFFCPTRLPSKDIGEFT
jgi:hypothetical protein